VAAALSYASGVSSVALIGRTIGDDLRHSAASVPDNDALVEAATGRRWTYRQLDDAVDRVASGLLATGLARGDRLGIWAPNCAEWVFVQYATARVGVVLVTINPAYRTHELQYVLLQAGIRTLMAAPSFKTTDYAAMIDQVRPNCPALESVVLFGSEAWDNIASTEITGQALEARAATLGFDDPINIQYTSGTTGFPKGATLSHHNILNNGFFVGHLLGYSAADRVCVPVPFYHCFGMVMGNLGASSNGSTIVIPAPAFDPAATLQAVQDERCTSLYGVPTMFITELALPNFSSYDLSSLRTGIMAGSPCPAEVMKRVVTEMHMDEVTIMYGMTETSPVSTMTRRDDTLDHRVHTVGTVMPHLEVQIVDPHTGLTVHRREPGEVCTRGYSVMLGYWDAPVQTAEAVDRADWMHTGDIGTMDDDGYVAIVGRMKDLVIRGGENIYPREIEEFLYAHPDIEDVQVIGVPDDTYGEELMAWVRLRYGAEPLTIDGLRQFCHGKLAHFKIPRYLHLTEEFPMTVTGKVRKVEMRARAMTILGRSQPKRPPRDYLGEEKAATDARFK
jgi:fatty-acyl-CoA synthase